MSQVCHSDVTWCHQYIIIVTNGIAVMSQRFQEVLMSQLCLPGHVTYGLWIKIFTDNTSMLELFPTIVPSCFHGPLIIFSNKPRCYLALHISSYRIVSLPISPFVFIIDNWSFYSLHYYYSWSFHGILELFHGPLWNSSKLPTGHVRALGRLHNFQASMTC